MELLFFDEMSTVLFKKKGGILFITTEIRNLRLKLLLFVIKTLCLNIFFVCEKCLCQDRYLTSHKNFFKTRIKNFQWMIIILPKLLLTQNSFTRTLAVHLKWEAKFTFWHYFFLITSFHISFCECGAFTKITFTLTLE